MIRLFDLSLQLNGFQIQEARLELRAIAAFNATEYETFLNLKKKAIVAYHLEHNSFYRELLGIKECKDWNHLPILTKKDLQIPLQDRLSDGFTPQNCYVNKTSGSSGNPFVFAKDKYCHALTWASNFYRFSWYGLDLNSSYQARFYGIPLDFLGYYKERFKDVLTHRFRFPVFDLSDVVLAQFLQQFKKRKFDYINGYTSAIVLFAKYLKQKNVILASVCPSLKVCVVTSEMLFASDKTLLETQLGIPIVNEYGASELDLIAFEKPTSANGSVWQVNSETVFVEIVDENNVVLPYGQEGRIVITSLYNKATPFIRYDTGDIGALDESSSLQHPILKKLVGRTSDIAILPSGKKAAGLTFYYITKSIIEDDGFVKEFTITQLNTTDFEVNYVSEFPLNTIQISKIERAVALYLESGLVFRFVQKPFLERNNRGKLKQFSSLM